MDMGLKGKRALVLGASRGLGAAIARALADEGAEVIAAARQAGNEPDLRYETLDLADPASIDALLERLVALGGVDVLVNNSGGPAAGPAHGAGAKAWQDAFSAMAVSIFSITDALLPMMVEKGWGRVITLGSSGVEQPIPNLALSNGVRGAIAGWSKTLAAEVAAYGVTVNMVLPGRIDTDRVRELDGIKSQKTGASLEAVKQNSQKEIPAGRYGTPQEFAAAVTFLASAQAGYVTGSMLRVDGGLIKGH
jgi:3-oxoacyl-[acyl-carrier protein] reductase